MQVRVLEFQVFFWLVIGFGRILQFLHFLIVGNEITEVRIAQEIPSQPVLQIHYKGFFYYFNRLLDILSLLLWKFYIRVMGYFLGPVVRQIGIVETPYSFLSMLSIAKYWLNSHLDGFASSLVILFLE